MSDNTKDCVKYRTICEIPEEILEHQAQVYTTPEVDSIVAPSERNDKVEIKNEENIQEGIPQEGTKPAPKKTGIFFFVLWILFLGTTIIPNMIKSNGTSTNGDLTPTPALSGSVVSGSITPTNQSEVSVSQIANENTLSRDLRLPVPKETILTVTFLDKEYLGMPVQMWFEQMGIAYWDVSKEKNNKVLAGLEDNSGVYDLYIAADDGVYAGNCTSLFEKYESLTQITFNHCFHTENATDMSYMFARCQNLKILDVSNFNTENVTDMSCMFQGCSELETLNIENFRTAKVTDMRGMFKECTNLTALKLSHFDTENVTDMQQMFWGCTNLMNLDVRSFNTSKVTSMDFMFSDCQNLTTLDVNSFDTSNVTSMKGMFSDCSNLKELNVSGFNTSNVERMDYMFSACKNLVELDVRNFDMSNVISKDGMYSGIPVGIIKFL